MASAYAPRLTPSISLRPLGLLAGGLVAAAIAVAQAGDARTAPAAAPPPALAGTTAPPVVPNRGQADPAVAFEARGGGATLFFTPGELVLAGPRAAVRQSFVGANPRPAVAAAGRLPGVVNLQRGADPARWQTGLPTFAGVAYRDVWRGVDARHDTVATAAGPWVHSTFTVAPGADAGQVRWRYAGGTRPSVDPGTGELRIAAGLRAAAPVAWQSIGGERRPVPAEYHVAADGSVGVSIGRHDRSAALVIGSPAAAGAAQAGSPALRFSSFLGGGEWDEMYDVEVDAAGDAYLAGFTVSPDFPAAGAGPSAFAGVQDAVVSRVGADGRLVYSTYLGGDATDAGQAVAVDRAGNAYVTGRTESEDFPVSDALRRPINGRRCQGEPCHDAFVTKLGPTGAVAYSTYLGGTGNEEGWGIAVDGGGRAHVTGNTDSDDFPTRRALQPVNRSRGCDGDLPCPLETFVAKLTSDGRGLVYSTYLGGRASDLSGGVALDPDGNAYVTGTTRSRDFPTRAALQPQIAGEACGPPPGVPCTDVFVAKLNRPGALVYSTYLGGTDSERSGGIAVDRSARVHLTGSTQSGDFPTASPVQARLDNASCTDDEPKELCDDAFVTGLRADGRALRFSTYLGGNAEDQGLGLAVGQDGAIHVAGSTDSRRFRSVNALQAKKGGAIDGFVARFAPGGRSLRFSTYLGGEKNERINGIAADAQGASLLTGRTDSPDFPTANPFQGALGGDIDAFVAKLR